jgi:predicted nucleic acid-binding protein
VIVVDTNVVAYYFIEGEKTPQARDLRRRDPHWCVPALWRHEYLNVLATFTREGGAAIADAQTLWRQSLELLGASEQDVDMETALALAAQHRISAYDAQYIALARQLKTVCVTEDKRLLAAFPELTRTMLGFLS